MKTLDAAKPEVIERLARLHPESRRRWGKMTPHQMLCHLSDSYRVPMGGMRISSNSGPFQRTVMKWVALRTPLPWPHGIATRPEIDQAAGGGTTPTEFELDRARLLLDIERFCSEPRDFEFAPHPIFGAMHIADWMSWGYRHADHHLRQFGC